jgi:methionyl-tRNA formyltransferase
MINNKTSILFLGKKNDPHCKKSLTFLKNYFTNVECVFGKKGDDLPEDTGWWKGDYIISYLSPWIVPESLLERCKIAAINFHPASPNYPGIGCTNFALYEEAKEYGATCHHMNTKVDTGNIIAVKRFPILPNDNVHSLTQRTYDFQLVLFYEVLSKILNDKPLPISTEKWTRKSLTRTELNALSVITPTMTKQEIEKRVRATSYQNFQPIIEIHNHIFELKTTENK